RQAAFPVYSSPYTSSYSSSCSFFLMIPPPPRSTLFPYTTLFRSLSAAIATRERHRADHTVTVHDRGPHLVVESAALGGHRADQRSEEHTSELQSQSNLVCRLLLEKKKHVPTMPIHIHAPRQTTTS